MCLDCLKNSVDECSELIDNISNITCECCKSSQSINLTIARSIKAYGLIKVKKHTIGCNNKLMEFESITKQRIINLLNNRIESVDNQKENMSDGDYLCLMNGVSILNSYFTELDEIDNEMVV